MHLILRHNSAYRKYYLPSQFEWLYFMSRIQCGNRAVETKIEWFYVIASALLVCGSKCFHICHWNQFVQLISYSIALNRIKWSDIKRKINERGSEKRMLKSKNEFECLRLKLERLGVFTLVRDFEYNNISYERLCLIGYYWLYILACATLFIRDIWIAQY